MPPFPLVLPSASQPVMPWREKEMPPSGWPMQTTVCPWLWQLQDENLAEMTDEKREEVFQTLALVWQQFAVGPWNVNRCLNNQSTRWHQKPWKTFLQLSNRTKNSERSQRGNFPSRTSRNDQ